MKYKITYEISVRDKNNEEWEELIGMNITGNDIADIKIAANKFIPNIIDALCITDKEVLLKELVEDENEEYVDHDEWFGYYKDGKLILEDEMM